MNYAQYSNLDRMGKYLTRLLFHGAWYSIESEDTLLFFRYYDVAKVRFYHVRDHLVYKIGKQPAGLFKAIITRRQEYESLQSLEDYKRKTFFPPWDEPEKTADFQVMEFAGKAILECLGSTVQYFEIVSETSLKVYYTDYVATVNFKYNDGVLGYVTKDNTWIEFEPDGEFFFFANKVEKLRFLDNYAS